MSHILGVGPGKPLGYLSFATLVDNGYGPQSLATCLRARGFGTTIITGTFLGGGALFVYDPASLQQLLDENRHVLLPRRWPTDAAGFVSKVAAVPVRQWESPSLYSLIGIAFRDPRFCR